MNSFYLIYKYLLTYFYSFTLIFLPFLWILMTVKSFTGVLITECLAYDRKSDKFYEKFLVVTK